MRGNGPYLGHRRRLERRTLSGSGIQGGRFETDGWMGELLPLLIAVIALEL